MTDIVEFWGVRGTHSCWGPDFEKVGGNTPCVSVTQDSGQIIIFDAGSGLISLGDRLKEQCLKEIVIIVSHYHLDHLQGLPFFKPIWDPEVTIRFITPRQHTGKSLESVLTEYLFCPPLFPVRFKDIPAQYVFEKFETGDTLSLFNDTVLKTHLLNHPGDSTGYRLEHAGKSFSYITDHEHDDSYDEDALVEFVKDSDMMLFDTTFTCEEFKTHLGWGHSSWEAGATVAQKARVKKFGLFHMSPDYTDDMLFDIARKAKKVCPNTFLCKENQSMEI